MGSARCDFGYRHSAQQRGETQVIALLDTGADNAIDGGDPPQGCTIDLYPPAIPAVPIETDRRGYPRSVGAHRDIDAWEFNPDLVFENGFERWAASGPEALVAAKSGWGDAAPIFPTSCRPSDERLLPSSQQKDRAGSIAGRSVARLAQSDARGCAIATAERSADSAIRSVSLDGPGTAASGANFLFEVSSLP